MSFNFITAAEAASYVKDGDIVGLSGFTPKPEGCDCRVSENSRGKTCPGGSLSDRRDYGSIDGGFL